MLGMRRTVCRRRGLNVKTFVDVFFFFEGCGGRYAGCSFI